MLRKMFWLLISILGVLLGFLALSAGSEDSIGFVPGLYFLASSYACICKFNEDRIWRS